MNNNQEKVKAALDRIENALDGINSNEDWLKYLIFQSRFYNYSSTNAMLIMLQNSEASYVKGYRAWNKMGRYVKRGSKGISIIAPCFRKVEEFKEPDNKVEYHDAEGEKVTRNVIYGFKVTYVFDLADTDGSNEFLPVLVTGLEGNSEREKNLYETLITLISKNYTIREVNRTSSKGSYNLESGVISIRSDLEYLQKIKTLLHEIAHAIDFSMHADISIKRNIRELIAESTAFVVAERLGLDTSRYSVSYIKSWIKDRDEIRDISDTVQKISYQIINMIAGADITSTPAFLDLEEESV